MALDEFSTLQSTTSVRRLHNIAIEIGLVWPLVAFVGSCASVAVVAVLSMQNHCPECPVHLCLRVRLCNRVRIFFFFHFNRIQTDNILVIKFSFKFSANGLQFLVNDLPPKTIEKLKNIYKSIVPPKTRLTLQIHNLKKKNYVHFAFGFGFV